MQKKREPVMKNLRKMFWISTGDSSYTKASGVDVVVYCHPRPIQKNANQMIVVSGDTYLYSVDNSENSFAINKYLQPVT
jgi:hypothetical protein